MLQLLRHSLPPLTIVTDYEQVVEGFQRGQAWCEASKQKNADVWRLIWHKVHDIGLDSITVEKVPAHCAFSAVLDGSANISIAE